MLIRTELRPELIAIVEWIKKETPAEARVLFEESGDETGFVYDGMYLSSFIPHWTGRELIGGPINLYNDRHHFAEFHSGKFLKKDIRHSPTMKSEITFAFTTSALWLPFILPRFNVCSPCRA